MSYDRRIVLDLDDTISLTLDRNWDNALPIQSVIDKSNELFDQGWEIVIVTARGQLSCNGDPVAAYEKYGAQVAEWLSRHGVKYTAMSFQKILATYYVDDKGLRPEEFAALTVETLSGGLSKAIVERRGDRVMKTGPKVANEAKWYAYAVDHLAGYIPRIHSFVGQTLTMDYVPHKPIMTYTELEVSQLMWIISLMRLQLPMLTTIDSPGDSLIQRVLKHSKSAQIELTENFFTAVHNICFTQSFCHGDFSLDNILSNDGKVTLIDPIYDESLYSSYVMDISKLLHSLRRKGYHSLTISTYQRLDSWFPELNGAQSLIFALELVQWIRVINYLPYETEKRRFKQFIQEALDGPLNYTAQYH